MQYRSLLIVSPSLFSSVKYKWFIKIYQLSLYALIQKYILFITRALEQKKIHWKIFINKDDLLDCIFEKNLSNVIAYDEYFLNMYKLVDFCQLHDISDKLNKEYFMINKEILEKDYGPIHIINLFEARWLEPAANSILTALVADKYIKRFDLKQLIAFDSSKNLYAVNVAANKNSIYCGPITQFYSKLSENIYFRKYYKFTKGMLPQVIPGINNKKFKFDYFKDKFRIKKNKCILVIGNHDRTIERLQKLLPSLTAEGYFIHLFSVDRVKLAKKLQNEGISCSFPSEWISQEEVDKICKTTDELASEMCDKIFSNSEIQDISINNLNFLSLAYPPLKGTILGGASYAIVAIKLARRIYETLRPSIILNFEDWEINRAFSFIAKKENIPTLGYYCLSNNTTGALIRRTHDYLAVSGEVLYDAFASQYEESKISIIGDSLIDTVNIKVSERVKNICKKILILMTYPSTGVDVRDLVFIVERTIEASKAINDCQIHIKLHPAQSEKEFRSWFDKNYFQPNVSISRNDNLMDLCLSSDLVVTAITTAAHQAMIAGVPVISVQSAESLKIWEEFGYDFLYGGGIIHVPVEVDLCTVFINLIDDDLQRNIQIQKGFNYVSKHVGPLDGMTNVRFMKLLNSILNSHK